ncbi:MAG: hypothetical protein K8U57_08475 [Planctomycetes bacterium]|nr:hypothetical protein [Planctomycetota bacterium]
MSWISGRRPNAALTLWRRFDAYDPARSFLSWALGVARLEAATWLRSRARLRFSVCWNTSSASATLRMSA